MNTTFAINGGAGRLLCSIPALEKYHRLNPQDNFKILSPAWTQMFWSHPLLQNKFYDVNAKGVFLEHVKPNRFIEPEPYQNYFFYNEKCNLIEAFDKIINNTDDHLDLNTRCLYTTLLEDMQAADFLNDIKQQKNRDKIVVMQPYGSSAILTNNTILDPTNRSISTRLYMKLVNEISKHAVIIYASSPEFRADQDTTSITVDHLGSFYRVIISILKQSDYFIGCDSSLQHIAYFSNIKGTVLFGGTNEKIFSYPSHFNIIRKKDTKPCYLPWRICGSDVDFNERLNEGLLSFTESEEDEIVNLVLQDMFNG